MNEQEGLAKELGLLNAGVLMEVSDNGINWCEGYICLFASNVWIDSYSGRWRYARKIAPKKKRWMTHAEAFKAQRDGAVFSGHDGEIFGCWQTSLYTGSHKLCYSYTGAETDVWQTMEVEE